MTRDELEIEIHDFIDRGFDAGPESESRFSSLAVSLFRFQYAHNAFYRTFVDAHVRHVDQITSWSDIPCLPVSAFKYAAVSCFPAAHALYTFRTSGTTLDRRGVLYLDDLTTYEKSVTKGFKHFCLPDRDTIAMASLIPSFARAADSSLSGMISAVVGAFGSRRSDWFFEDTRPDYARFVDYLNRSAAESEPVMLLGTSLVFLDFIRFCRDKHHAWLLPPGSCVMDTGGGKGRHVSVLKRELHEQLMKFLGIPVTHFINEYGMTEMGSQYYDTRFRDALAGRAVSEEKQGPPWVRVRVTDPLTGGEVPVGREGVLCHYDLANIGSVLALETEDLGVRTERGFEFVGRVQSSELRGCSLAAEGVLHAGH